MSRRSQRSNHSKSKSKSKTETDSDEVVVIMDTDEDDDEDHDDGASEESEDSDDELEDIGPRKSKRRRPAENSTTVSSLRNSNRRTRSDSYEKTSTNDNNNNNNNKSQTSRPSRTNRFQGSMKDPVSESVRDLYQSVGMTDRLPPIDPKNNISTGRSSDRTTGTNSRIQKSNNNNNNNNSSKSKSKTRTHHSSPQIRRQTIRTQAETSSSDDDFDDEDEDENGYGNRDNSSNKQGSRTVQYDDDDDDDDADEDDNVYDDQQEELKIQRILASRSETKARWKEITVKMNSSEVTHGSVWTQPSLGDQSKGSRDGINDKDEDDDQIVEERFLVKWSGYSFLHVSWETQADLMEQIPNAKTYFTNFFRKATHGILLSQDDRKDGDYFDPGYTQIDRILEVFYDYDHSSGRGKHNKGTNLPRTWEQEQAISPIKEFNIILDPYHPDFEEGTGRQFLIKWQNMPYSECTYEFERDLILAEEATAGNSKTTNTTNTPNDMEEDDDDDDDEYKVHLRAFYQRSRKPTQTEWKAHYQKAERATREAYKLFGDNHFVGTNAKSREDQTKQYQQDLAKYIFPNGGQLRDYQAEGVSWFLANYINHRSCILADEMGLGKTLQTAAFINLLVTKMYRPGPFLVVVPLSTITHWQREFVNWTGLNTIVYHGSAEDRDAIRRHEFAYIEDRPDEETVGYNTIYLTKCASAKNKRKSVKKGAGSDPWMATVVICTPEMLTAEDANELKAVPWEVLVVDEAHRLKNHNSKLAMTLRKDIFSFNHKVLLTGTPIQNDMKEFWTLLNFIDPKGFDDMDEFLEEYGAIKSKEKIDEMHETIRPYILRRLKEDVEKSVPPKEETLIEVELTIQQKQYYRALYEKNVFFLQKNKKKALDGPSLNNLAMQLRKCCNHLFLLNGVEEELRRQKDYQGLSEADILAKGSGKLVLLDKLLPRLKADGHRVLIFSQFKIMLDVLEDYLDAKQEKFERIDGSITGHRRQAAIDRYQDSSSKNPPFIMLLSTRAGGVGINLTSADTCIIFDSDWNPQNDLQAQARCHRIGQTKNVKVYRLLSRKSYEMQMFHMSSLKMGLDQAVLKGFESGASGEGTMTKEEVERLLRHGAYDIFNEEKNGNTEAESNDFVEQDIDSILARRATTVVHNNTGSGSNAAGGTFSKASFVAPKTPSGNKALQEDVDIEDPDFWKKMIGEAKEQSQSILKPRKRNTANYSEREYNNQIQKMITLNPSDSDSSDAYGSDNSNSSDEEIEDEAQERARWGGNKPDQWTKAQAQAILECLERYGYGILPWEDFKGKLMPLCSKFEDIEMRRMTWAVTILAICLAAKEDATSLAKRAEREADRKREVGRDGDILAARTENERAEDTGCQKEVAFSKLWTLHSKWLCRALDDAISFAREHQPRQINSEKNDQSAEVTSLFYNRLWEPLKGRGWKEETSADGKIFKFGNHKFDSPSAVLNEILKIHPELSNMVVPLLNELEQKRQAATQNDVESRSRDLALNSSNIGFKAAMDFLARYAPLQLLGGRGKTKRLAAGKRLLSTCSHLHEASIIVNHATATGASLSKSLVVDRKASLPHPKWTRLHDATLIKALLKFGWIERDSAYRSLVLDSTIKWGYPFEEGATATDLENTAYTIDAKVAVVAKRAAYFLELFDGILEPLKGVNRHLIIEAYGLKHSAVKDDETQRSWVVDEDLLRTASRTDESTSEFDVTDLPAKKDMVKRAKLVISKSLLGPSEAITKAAGAQKGKEKEPGHGFTIIDQGNPCFILLAEMLRGICKSSMTKSKVEVRQLCSIAFDEAVSLKRDFAHGSDESDTFRSAEIVKIVDQIQLARHAMAISATTGKNLLRAMIGLEPLKPKNATDPIYPSEDFLNKHAKVPPQPKAKVVPPKAPKKDEGALGDRALTRCLKKVFERKDGDGTPNHFVSVESSDTGLQLTMMEVTMLQVFCSEGIPLCKASSSREVDNGKDAWKSCLDHLINNLESRLAEAEAKLKKFQDQIEADDTVNRDLAVKIVATEWEIELLQFSKTQSNTISAEMFAKKSVMLLEKIRLFAFPSLKVASKHAQKFENYLGVRVVGWFGKELYGLAADWDVLTGSRPIAASFSSIMTSDSNERVAAYLDKKSARQVTSQITLLSRLQSLFALNSESVFKVRLEAAVSNSKRQKDVWEKQPTWWNFDDEEEINASLQLLSILNEERFSKVMQGNASFHKNGRQTMKEHGFTKLSIQQRANQLVRELHAAVESAEALRRLEERKKKNKGQGFYDRSLADCHTTAASAAASAAAATTARTPKESSTSENDKGSSSSLLSSSTAKKNRIQTGISAFFSSKRQSSGGSGSVRGGSDDEKDTKSKVMDVEVVTMSHTSKRKGSPTSHEFFSEGKKKTKKLAPLFVSEDKSKGKGSSTTITPSPDKKIQTVVNEDGVIEIVAIPR